MRLLYLLLIALSNVLTAKFNPFVLAGGLLVIPVGSLFAGAVFVLRDLVQMKHGRANTYKLILGATFLSVALSHALGNTAHVAAASMVAFFISEAADTELFSRMRTSLVKRVLVSGTVGGCLDSTIFVVLGLSPWASGILPWNLVPFAILSQTLVKLLVQLVAAGWLILRRGGGQRELDI
jgi:uncharacterized PurR-regulated membrane protein YhhQ (DUF165 family)